MITGINELERLTKHVSCKYECKFHAEKCNSVNVRGSGKIRKNIVFVKKIIFGILLHVVAKMVDI